MKKENISYRLQITEEEKIVAEQLVSGADYLPRIGEVISIVSYEGPLDDFVEKIRMKEEKDPRCSRGGYALLRFQQEYAGNYQVIQIQHHLNIFANTYNSFKRINNTDKVEVTYSGKDLTQRGLLEIFPEFGFHLRQSSIPLVVMRKFKGV